MGFSLFLGVLCLKPTRSPCVLREENLLNHSALLVLEDGTTFYGDSIGSDGVTVGEVVFNTAITGYQEILTDPSYARQLVTLTYPHIGNVGVNPEDEESRAVFCAGFIVRDVPKRFSNWRSEQGLNHYLADRRVVAISGIDTRKLTRHLRMHGTLRGCIYAQADMDRQQALSLARAFPGLQGMDLAKEVTVDSAYQWRGGGWALEQGYREPPPSRFRIVACDYGVKHTILRLLAERGCEITVVPATTNIDNIVQYQPDGVFLSNGPGDPEPCDYAIDTIAALIERGIPLFGICLGHQLLCLASGAKTQKMKFGHHGANHPVQDLLTRQVLITSQNHGFTVDEESVGPNLRITHRSLFDDTIQGVERTDKPAFSFQGHPEASPGPRDIRYLFDRFISLIEQVKGVHDRAET